VTINGSGFICTPTFPGVNFDTAAATVLSCGTTAVIAQAPAHALGASTVTVVNTGGTASNGLTFTYTDTTKPTFSSIAVAKDVLTVTFDEPVCGTYADADWIVQNISAGATDYAGVGSTSNLPLCTGTPVSSFNIFLTATVPPGAFVEASLLTGANITDASANTANAPQSRQATATAGDTTKPTLLTASGAVAQNNVTLTFSEPVWCPTALEPAAADFLVDDTTSTTDPTVTAVTGCATTRPAATSTFTITLSAPIKASTGYTITVCGAASPVACGANNATGEIQDASLNSLTVPASVSFTGGAADFTPPTMVDARMSNNQATTDFNDAGDQFKVTFSEKMNGVTTGALIDLQDQDGTTGRITCGSNATCAWDSTGTGATTTILTVSLTAALTNPSGGAGSTPGMAIPFNITSIGNTGPGTQITDLQGNPPNVLGSPDRLVDFEF
jgi:hypothetical protein